MSDRHDIVCLSSQRWDEPMWTNKQHIMSRLAKDHRVVHVDFGLRPLPVYLARRLRRQPRDLLRPWRILTDGVQHRAAEGLYVADSFSPLWVDLLREGHPVRNFASFDLKILMLQRFLKREGIEAPIVWVYHPGYADAVDRLPRKLLVYDCVDNYAAFPAYRDEPEWLMRKEERLCRNADLVVTTSRELLDLKAPYNPQHTHLVHNVGDYDHFRTVQDPSVTVAPEIERLEGPVVGFVGAVSDYKLDVDWLLHASERHPEWNLVIVGPVGLADPSTDVSRLQARKNVHLLGQRSYAELPRYVKGFDVAAIPYRINAYTRSVFPIKFFEFLATGRPVVISNLPALAEFYEAVHVAEDADGFVARCEEALAAPERGLDERLALARAHSWPARIGKIMDLVEARLREKRAARGSTDA